MSGGWSARHGRAHERAQPDATLSPGRTGGALGGYAPLGRGAARALARRAAHRTAAGRRARRSLAGLAPALRARPAGAGRVAGGWPCASLLLGGRGRASLSCLLGPPLDAGLP